MSNNLGWAFVWIEVTESSACAQGGILCKKPESCRTELNFQSAMKDVNDILPSSLHSQNVTSITFIEDTVRHRSKSNFRDDSIQVIKKLLNRFVSVMNISLSKLSIPEVIRNLLI